MPVGLLCLAPATSSYYCAWHQPSAMVPKRPRLSAKKEASLESMADQLEHQQGKKAIFEKLAGRPELIPKLLNMLEPRAWTRNAPGPELTGVGFASHPRLCRYMPSLPP